jgi:hypothetical protein
MKLAGAFFLFGFLCLTAFVYFSHDLRGWTPANSGDASAIVLPVNPADKPFALSQCLAGTIAPFQNPRAHEYSGDATLTILSCRSKPSAAALWASYFVLMISIAVVYFAKKKRRG